MPSITINFTHEEKEQFEDCYNGANYKSVIEETDNYLRNKIKYNDLPSEIEAIYQEVRDFLHQELRDAGLSVF